MPHHLIRIHPSAAQGYDISLFSLSQFIRINKAFNSMSIGIDIQKSLAFFKITKNLALRINALYILL